MSSNFKSQFMLDSDTIFLNHGSFGACAKPVYEDLLKWQKIMEKEPVKFFEDTLYDALKVSRKSLGDYIGCSSDDLAYFPNPTTAINAVARSLKLKPGEEVLSTNHIYGAMDRSWEYICAEKRVRFVKADIPFVSTLAITRLISKHNMKGAEINKLKKEEMEFWESLEEHKGDTPHKHPHDEDELDELQKVSRQLKDPKKEVMLVKKNKVIVVECSDYDTYIESLYCFWDGRNIF